MQIEALNKPLIGFSTHIGIGSIKLIDFIHKIHENNEITIDLIHHSKSSEDIKQGQVSCNVSIEGRVVETNDIKSNVILNEKASDKTIEKISEQSSDKKSEKIVINKDLNINNIKENVMKIDSTKDTNENNLNKVKESSKLSETNPIKSTKLQLKGSINYKISEIKVENLVDIGSSRDPQDPMIQFKLGNNKFNTER